VLPRTEDITDEGLHRVLITGEYLVPGPEAAAQPAEGGAPPTEAP
jgi:hypothetical protein